MNECTKEMSAEDGPVETFVRSRAQEPATDELDFVVGGCGPEIDPDG